jgi:hypothetical protein
MHEFDGSPRTCGKNPPKHYAAQIKIKSKAQPECGAFAAMH